WLHSIKSRAMGTSRAPPFNGVSSKLIGDAYIEHGNPIAQFGKGTKIIGEKPTPPDESRKTKAAAIIVGQVGARAIMGIFYNVVGQHDPTIEVEFGQVLKTIVVIGPAGSNYKIVPFGGIPHAIVLVPGIAKISAQADNPRAPDIP